MRKIIILTIYIPIIKLKHANNVLWLKITENGVKDKYERDK